MLDIKEKWPQEIRETRLKMGLTQEQFATKLGVSFLTVNRWENQKSKPSRLATQKLKKLLLKQKRKSSGSESRNKEPFEEKREGREGFIKQKRRWIGELYRKLVSVFRLS